MIRAIEGPLIVQPRSWTLVFNREASSRWFGALVPGRYKHVRAYAYVPFLHVWVFYDPDFRGTDIIVAADGEPAKRLIASWTVKADLMMMRVTDARARPRIGFWCVPMIKSLIGLRSSALRPDGLWADCLANGGEPFESPDGCTGIQATSS